MEVRRFLVWLRQQGKVRNALLRECLGEVLGTFIFMMFGCAALAQVKTSRGSKGQYLSANMAFSVGVMCAMYCCRGISGAHMNPAVSLSCCVLGRLAWSKLLPYCLAQVIGAFLAAGLVFLMYHDAIMSYSGGVLTVYGPNETASIFATYPVEFLSLGSSFLDQVVGTGMVLLCFLPLDDQQNSPAPPDLVPPLAATVLLGVSMSMSYNCGGGINPARDFGPRLFTFMAGWGSDVFTCYNYWFWVPIAAPMLGAVIGSYIYLIFIQWHLPDPDTDTCANLLYHHRKADISNGNTDIFCSNSLFCIFEKKPYRK
uniref:Aquaporin 10a n=1 Tax=Electrophorus electricus TaxID=8005 RepID=A0A4W4ELU9_ELEEL